MTSQLPPPVTSLADEPPAPDQAAVELAALSGPESLAGMNAGDLRVLAAKIRAFLIEKVCATGGHLGVVELTVALHRVFDTPRDVIVFDTGHQAYVHKILTGRAGGFARLRQAGGLSGYPCRAESAHDWVENSHASTALSYADGIAKALRVSGEHRLAITVEDGLRNGGIGAAITQLCDDQGVPTPVRTMGLPSAFIPHGDRAGLLARYELTCDGIVRTVWNSIKSV